MGTKDSKERGNEMSKNGKPLAPGATDSEGIVIIRWEEEDANLDFDQMLADVIAWERVERDDWID
jgi:hypothetical protein